ncbi:MAG TPA: alpha/beta hydrolase [Dictyobacter sp.]|nr:alpha/beta hydrolase [Dictyobacter sp.]
MTQHEIHTGFLQVQGAPLYYEVAGQGPAVLLFHAGIADNRMWDEQFSRLAQQYRTIRFDLRGFGQSIVPSGRFAPHEDPAALLRSLGIEKVHVIAASYGASVALDFTLMHPELVASLVLVAPTVGGFAPSEEMITFWQQEEELLEAGDVVGATALNVHMWVDGPQRTPDQVDASIRQRVYDMQYRAFTLPQPAAEAEAVELDPPAIQRLQEVRVPTLIIVGSVDLVVIQQLAQQLKVQIAQAELRIVADVAHMVTMEQPEEALKLIHAFYEKQ